MRYSWLGRLSSRWTAWWDTGAPLRKQHCSPGGCQLEPHRKGSQRSESSRKISSQSVPSLLDIIRGDVDVGKGVLLVVTGSGGDDLVCMLVDELE